MSNQKTFTRTAIALALSALFPIAGAFADEVEELTNPNVADVAGKLQYQDKVNPLYRQYNGVNHDGVNGAIEADIVRRSEDGGWFKLKARDLGLSTQEFGASYEQQGDWSIGIDYNQIPRYSPYQISTAVSGIGTATITQPSYANAAFSGGALRNPSLYDVTLKTERDITTLTASKYLIDGLKLGFSFKNEDKNGTRMDSVRGTAGTYGTAGSTSVNRYSGFLFSPEPINQTHQQFEGTLEYVTSQFQIAAGYYGSFLTTKHNALSVVPGNNTTLVSTDLSPIALAPDNSFNQFYVNGAYNFSKDTRANLKVSYSEGIQNEQFLTLPAAQITIPNGNSLDGKVQTTEVFSSLTSRITRDLKVLASWRYEDKQDKTPIRAYAPIGSASFVYNNPESHKANWGKAEVDYNIGAGFGVTGGVDYTQKKSEEWARKQVEDWTTRLALRKNMSETVNGSVSIAHSERSGSEWEGGKPDIYPVYLADRKRDKVRGMVDWTVIEKLNLQFAYEAYFDNYSKSDFGLDSGEGQIFSIDASYDVTDNWKINAWYSNQIGESKQNARGAACATTNNSNCTASSFTNRAVTPTDYSKNVVWDATLKLNSEQFGFGLSGKLGAASLGAQYLYSDDRNKQNISGIPASTFTSATATAAVASGVGVLPDTKYTQNTFKLFGVYPVAKTTKLRLDYIYDLRKMDDYTWTNWVYADGTKVYVKPNQTTQILGLTLIQSF